MLRQTLLLLVTTLALGLAACGGNRATQADAAGAGMGAGGAGASTAGMGGAGGPEVFREVPGQGTGPLSRLVIYFDYDQSDIRAEYNEVLAAHGGYLAANSTAGLRLEGHADERGSREYNIGLGERRAQAVRRALLLQGAGAVQLTTVSYGEERPAAFGSDEEAYSLNRRVELVYR
ncbi:MAG TPA: peptidoglycan-associated lipoprotein Pal [Gammaproteobacteria bacterium]|nr:peptidoglycan-associated lipoprotein Pal [Gammaproteobacteria bacterium]